MKNRSINPVIPQESFIQRAFDGFIEQASTKDTRPHPLIVSERWQFPLTYVDTNGNPDDYLYCARDWYMGLGGDKAVWSRSKADWLLSSQPVMIETKRERRQPEMLEYVNQYGLYRIAQVMKPRKGETALGEIQAYLAAAGVLFAQLARGNHKAKKLVKSITPTRLEAIEERKNFTATIKGKHVKHKPQYALLSNMVYSRVLNAGDEYTAKRVIVAELGLSDKQAKNLRDNINDLALSAITMAEKAAIAAMNNRPNLLSDDEMMYIVKHCARITAVSARQLAEFAGVDLLTGKPLLGSGNREQE